MISATTQLRLILHDEFLCKFLKPQIQEQRGSSKPCQQSIHTPVALRLVYSPK
jgi:hypothetical protein